MYGIPDNLNRQRYRNAISEFCDTLSGMVLLPQLLLPSIPKPRQNSTQTRAGIEQVTFDNKDMKPAANTNRSSASTPSLRSRDGTLPPHMMRMDGGGNVRVVVRVRAFLPRGTSCCFFLGIVPEGLKGRHGRGSSRWLTRLPISQRSNAVQNV